DPLPGGAGAPGGASRRDRYLFCGPARLDLVSTDPGPGLTSSFDGNPSLVLREPRVERLKPRGQGPREGDAPRAAELVVKVALDLDYVAEFLGAGEPEPAVDLGRPRFVPAPPAQRLRKPRAHPPAREVLPGDAALLADYPPAATKDAIGTAANVLDRDRRQ